ncbi:MAG: hypothetical protein GX299_04770 [Epulopiscium sp.]|jgi:hypothetical protein|nr:hypothetical protein [Candidatus Epulonipiscium sp.]
MKKYFDTGFSMEDLKDVVTRMNKKENKKSFCVCTAIITAVLLAVIAATVYCLKKKMEDDYDEDWDCDWDNLDEEDCDCGDDCCCTDKDVDTSIKVEKL